MADETPIERFRAGDREALGPLLANELPALRAFVRSRLSPALRAKESAEDIVQSTCREILSHADRFQHGGEEGFRRWLFTTALRKIQHRWQHYSSQKRDVAREAGDDGGLIAGYAGIGSPSGEAASAEEVARIEAAFDALEEGQREIISLVRILGLSSEEAGQYLGVSPGAVRTRLSRALARLAEELEG